MRTGVLFSGGKDSCLALHKAIECGKKIDCLLSLMPENIDSFMFHKPDLKLLKKQAEMLDLPLVIQKTKGRQDEELGDLRKLVEKSKVDVLVVGGIASNYQGSRIKKLCGRLGVDVYAPLLDYTTEKLWKELLDSRFKVIITKISCEGIQKEFIGKVIDATEFEKLKKLSEKYKFRLDFEGGEAETAVLFMPDFSKDIKIRFAVKSEDKYRHFIEIKEVC